MINRNMHGNPVLPARIKKIPRMSGSRARWKETIESGVKVNPKSLNIDAGVKIPLSALATMWALEWFPTHHHSRDMPKSLTTEPHVSVRRIHGSNTTTPRK
jgi:hypothetical protein